jgi:hypothetical protein
MAQKKNVPLKDEELNLSDKIDERFDSVDSDLAEIKRNKVDIASLETKVANLPDNMWNHLDKKLDERIERIREREKAEGYISTNECIDQLNETVDVFNKRHEKVVGVVKMIAGYLQNIDEYVRGKKKTAPQVEPILAQIEAIDVTDVSESSFPSIPPKDGKWGKLLLYDIPTYTVQRIKHSKTLRQFFALCMFLTMIIISFLLIFVSRENAYLREQNASLRQTEAKYYLLRKASRHHKEWSKNADYIEFLYTDPEQNRDAIQQLWQKANATKQ